MTKKEFITTHRPTGEEIKSIVNIVTALLRNDINYTLYYKIKGDTNSHTFAAIRLPEIIDEQVENINFIKIELTQTYKRIERLSVVLNMDDKPFRGMYLINLENTYEEAKVKESIHDLIRVDQ